MKKALLVGINYLGTQSELAGCLNDSHNMHALLTEQYAFDDVKLVLEDDATVNGILNGLEWLIRGTVPGDVIVFHYSGHGSRLPSKTESDGYEEIICPIDLNWDNIVIDDSKLKMIFNLVPDGVNVTVILDCCHSGTGLNQDTAYLTPQIIAPALVKPDTRFMPPPAGLIDDRTHVVNWTASRDINKTAMLIAACKEDQLAADAYINGQHQGAATASLISSVKAVPDISYIALIDMMASYLLDHSFSQQPELDGFMGLYHVRFLSPFNAR